MDAAFCVDCINILCSRSNYYYYIGIVMKLIIAGSRSIIDYDVIKRGYLDSGIHASEIVSGAARGVDRLGERLAVELSIPCYRFPADWNGLGKKAGYVRNVQMAEYAEGLLAYWDGESKGTKHMLDIAKQKDLWIMVYTTEGMRWTI